MCMYVGMYVSICEQVWVQELDTVSYVFSLNLNYVFNLTLFLEKICH